MDIKNFLFFNYTSGHKVNQCLVILRALSLLVKQTIKYWTVSAIHYIGGTLYYIILMGVIMRNKFQKLIGYLDKIIDLVYLANECT